MTRHVRLFPRLELTADINRGEERFAAKVILAKAEGQTVPPGAENRAIDALERMAGRAA